MKRNKWIRKKGIRKTATNKRSSSILPIDQIKKQLLSNMNWVDIWRIQTDIIGNPARYQNVKDMKARALELIKHLLNDEELDYVASGQFMVRRVWDETMFYYELNYIPFSSVTQLIDAKTKDFLREENEEE